MIKNLLHIKTSIIGLALLVFTYLKADILLTQPIFKVIYPFYITLILGVLLLFVPDKLITNIKKVIEMLVNELKEKLDKI